MEKVHSQSQRMTLVTAGGRYDNFITKNRWINRSMRLHIKLHVKCQRRFAVWTGYVYSMSSGVIRSVIMIWASTTVKVARCV